jgi:hypothetical protein
MLAWAKGTARHPCELSVRAVVLSAVDKDGLPGLGRVQARTEPGLVLPLVQINRQRASEHHAPRAPVLDDGERHILYPIQGLLGQLGNTAKRLLGRIGVDHDQG